MKIIGIEHIGIAIKSLSKAKKFWSLVLGIKNTSTEDIENQGVITDIYDTGNGKIELLLSKYPSSAIAKFIKKQGAGIHHICLSVENMDEAIIKLKEKYHALEMGKAIVGNNDKNKTKRKIKKMINEIDDCIVQLTS